MLHFYQQIEIFDDGEISPGFIWSKLYGLFHRQMIKIQDKDGLTPVGVSFPGYGNDRFPLGSVLRLFAPDVKTLEHLNMQSSLENLRDYVTLLSIREIPETFGHARFYRKQFKNTNPERLARRYAKRHGVPMNEALQRYESLDSAAVMKENTLPYIHLISGSTGQRHRLFIVKEAQKDVIEGRFNTYGLSKTTTVPCF